MNAKVAAQRFRKRHLAFGCDLGLDFLHWIGGRFDRHRRNLCLTFYTILPYLKLFKIVGARAGDCVNAETR
jgi:hypothetical protein